MRSRSLIFRVGLPTAAVLFCIGALLGGCSDEPASTSTAPSQASADGFSFFDMTAQTRLSDELRGDLKKKLGSEAISRRSTLDLQIPPESFLKKQFPRVQSLNRRLNYSPRERIEHDITRLMYRYPSRNQLPFSFVELVFSNETGHPLVFHTSAKQEGSTVLQTLQDKYGDPDIAEWDGGRQNAHYWRKSGELMVVYALRDRFGNREYQVQLLFLDAIESLVRIEEKEREIREQEKEKAVRDAF
jgi:hypothetical protein